MYLQDYFLFLGLIIFCAILSAIVSAKVHKVYDTYARIPARSHVTGRQAAEDLMHAYGVFDVAIGRVGGRLADHYHPTKKIVNLSDDTYTGTSVAALAVTAHEIGHVMQKKNGFFFYRIRTALVPVVNIGMFSAMPLVLIGLLIDYASMNAETSYGFYLALIGVALYGGALVFSLVTLPVELDAGRRAKKMLLAQGILQEDEIQGASKVLTAAAMTYVVSLFTSLVYFLRFLLRVLTLFGRRQRR